VTAQSTWSVFAGIDWGGSHHQLRVVDSAGAQLFSRRFAHDVAGLSVLCTELARHAHSVPIAIERVKDCSLSTCHTTTKVLPTTAHEGSQLLPRPPEMGAGGPVLGATRVPNPVRRNETEGVPSRIAGAAEDDAFWTWAIIKTLRHSGIRHKELLEIAHLALVSYRLADTGELVSLLQILPSKNNQEQLPLVSPELASVPTTIITRLRECNGGTVPLVSRYDHHERTFGPMLPHLFQRRTRGDPNEVISNTTSKNCSTRPSPAPTTATPPANH
jgi:Transposase